MDYTPPQTIFPQPVIEYAYEHTDKNTRKILYHAADIDNCHIYVVRFLGTFNEKYKGKREFVDAPMSIIYNNGVVHHATGEELSKLWIYETPKYFPTSEEQIYRFDNKD